MGFMAHLLVQTGLPHSRRDSLSFVRTNGSLQVPISAQLPLAAFSRERFGQGLERYLPPERRVLGAIDLSHTARTELVDNPVFSDRIADHSLPRGYPILLGDHREDPTLGVGRCRTWATLKG